MKYLKLKNYKQKENIYYLWNTEYGKIYPISKELFERNLLNASLEEIPIPEDSNLFLYLSRIQEEVHRYAITYHRNIKAKGALSSTLDMVPGIGEKRRKELLKQFGSLKKMKEAKIEGLEKIVGKDVAKNLYDYLHEE